MKKNLSEFVTPPAFLSLRRLSTAAVIRTLSLVGMGAVCCALQSGCVTGRRVVPLPVASTSTAAATKGDFAVAAVSDGRRFENKPPSPSTPSIDGDVEKISPTERSVFIGRQRNGYGKALGDITLPANDSVVLRMQALIEEGVKRRGFSVAKSKGDAANSANVVINEFWAWFTPGMWAVTFEARVACSITLKRADEVKTLVVQGHGTNVGQVASDANWQLAYSRAFDDFMTNLQREMEKVGY